MAAARRPPPAAAAALLLLAAVAALALAPRQVAAADCLCASDGSSACPNDVIICVADDGTCLCGACPGTATTCKVGGGSHKGAGGRAPAPAALGAAMVAAAALLALLALPRGAAAPPPLRAPLVAASSG